MRARQATSRRARRHVPSMAGTVGHVSHHSVERPRCLSTQLSGALPIQSGATVGFSCLDGFEPSGELLCERGQLSGAQCNPSSCFVAPDIPNIEFGACPETRSGEQCAHRCEPGFVASGRATCSNGTWELGDATCTAVEVNNGCSLPDVENGYFDPIGWVGALDGQALDSNKISCDQGYTRTNLGGLSCACPINGIPCEMLTGLCEPIQCPQVDIVANGVVAGANCLGGDAIFRPTCEFFCEDGYAIVGASRIECGLSGAWPEHRVASPSCAHRCEWWHQAKCQVRPVWTGGTLPQRQRAT